MFTTETSRLHPGLIAGLLVGLAILLAPAAPTSLWPPQAIAAECEGDECQGAPLAPDDPAPGTAVVEGPPNPPPHWPKSGKATHRHSKRGGHHHASAHHGRRGAG